MTGARISSPQAATGTGRGGIPLGLASAVGFGLMAVWATYAYEAGMTITTVLTLRFTIAALVFWAVVAVRRPVWPERRVVVSAFALGAVGYAAQAGAFFGALTRIDAGLASLLLYAYPGLVIVAALALRRETASRQRIGALLVATTGICLVLLGGGAVQPDGVGIALALTAAFVYATYILVSDDLLGRIDPFLLAAIIVTGAAFTFLLTGTASGTLRLDFAAAGWLDVGLLAVVSTVLPVIAFMLALERIGAGTVSIVSTVEPVVTATLAWLLFGQQLGGVQILGGALVLSAVVLLQWRRSTVLIDDSALYSAAGAAIGPAARHAA